jgi:hypothetical protein
MYRAVGDGNAASDLHRGVQAEAAVLRDLLYGDRETWLSRILPVILPGRSVDELPAFVQPASASHFAVETITDEGVEGLLRVLTGQPRHVPPPRGRIPALPPEQVSPPRRPRNFRLPSANVRRALALTATLSLAALVLAIPGGRAPTVEIDAHDAREEPGTAPSADSGSTTAGPSHERPSAATSLPRATGSPGAGDQSRRAPVPDGDEWAAVMPEGAPTDGMPSHQGVVDVLAVGHSFTSQVDRITVTVRNTSPDDVLVRQIDLFMDDYRGSGHEWSDGYGMWPFTISADMTAGGPAYDGSQRVHGSVRMGGTEFSQPLVGRGYIYGDEVESWRRLLTFSPQRFLAGAATVSIVIDVPLTHLLQSIGSNGAAGPVTEQELDPQVGAVFTRVDIWTPDDHSFACDYLRRPEDKPVCDQVDPAAAVELPG